MLLKRIKLISTIQYCFIAGATHQLFLLGQADITYNASFILYFVVPSENKLDNTHIFIIIPISPIYIYILYFHPPRKVYPHFIPTQQKNEINGLMEKMSGIFYPAWAPKWSITYLYLYLYNRKTIPVSF